jgi:hypothetical protein
MDVALPVHAAQTRNRYYSVDELQAVLFLLYLTERFVSTSLLNLKQKEAKLVFAIDLEKE